MNPNPTLIKYHYLSHIRWRRTAVMRLCAATAVATSSTLLNARSAAMWIDPIMKACCESSEIDSTSGCGHWLFFIKDRGHVVGRAVDSIQAIHQYAARVINAIFNSRYIWILEFNRSIYRSKGNPSSFELHGFWHGGCFFIFDEFMGLPVRIDIDL